MYTQIKIGEVPVTMCVDTGASLTIIKERLWQVLKKEGTATEKLKEYIGPHIYLANESKYEVKKGYTTITWKEQGKEIKFNALVMEKVPYPIIMGNDCLEQLESVIDVKKGIWSMKGLGIELPIKIKQEGIEISTVQSHQKQKVMPLQQKEIIVRVPQIKEGIIAIEESNDQPYKELTPLFPFCLIEVKDYKGKLLITNVTDEELVFKKGIQIGCATRITKIYSLWEEVEKERQEVNIIPSREMAERMIGGKESEKSATEQVEIVEDDEYLLIKDNIEFLFDYGGTEHLSKEEKEILEKSTAKWRHIFLNKFRSNVTNPPVKHQMHLESQKVINHRNRRMTLGEAVVVETYVKDMLDQGVIQNSFSPHNLPILLTKKSDGSDRFCIDFRPLNKITKKDNYLLPRIEEIFDALRDSKYFTTLDCGTGFWQISLELAVSEYTVFSTLSKGHYEFKVMPFGLCNAPATYQRNMNTILAGLTWQICLVYVDDIIIYSKTFTEHIQSIERVLERLEKVGFWLKPKKSKFCQLEVNHLGHIISKEGIRCGMKVKAIQDCGEPKNVEELLKILGMINYYRKFVYQLSDITSPLYELTRKNQLWVWTETHTKCLERIKMLLADTVTLKYPDPNKGFHLYTDASAVAISAVLAQEDEKGEIRPVYFASKLLQQSERNYYTTDRECLAVVWGIKMYHHYLANNHFIIITDHKAIETIYSKGGAQGRRARWILDLQVYDYKVIHRPGKDHNNADALTRPPWIKDDLPIEVEKPLPDLERIPFAEGIRKAVEEVLERFLNKKLEQKDIFVAIKRASVLTLGNIDQEMEREGKEKEEGKEETILNMKREQEKDPIIQKYIKFLKGEEGQEVDEKERKNLQGITQFMFFDNEGVLRYSISQGKQGKFGRKEEGIKIVLPNTLKKAVLHESHDSPLIGGHFGFLRTYRKIKERYWWETINKDVQNYVNSCIGCQKKKGNKIRYTELTPIIVTRPLELVGVDLMGPLNKSQSVYKYIIVVIDHFTRYVDTAVLKTATV